MRRSVRRRQSRASAVHHGILGAPQIGFSLAKRRISSRTSSLILGLPLRRRDRQRQYNRKPARCQATTVSGLTIRSTSFQPDQKRRRRIQNSRSQEFKGGRGRFRFRTASCCRSARTSSAVPARQRKKTPKAAKSARQKGSTNNRCNTSSQKVRAKLGARNRNMLISLNDVFLTTHTYYHQDRIHDSLAKDTPNRRPMEDRPSPDAEVVSKARIGGLHHRYEWQEAA